MHEHAGWLIYGRKDYEKNKWFADRFINYGPEFGLDIRLVLREDINYGISGGKAFINVPDDSAIPEFAINRCMDVLLGKQLEALGSRVFNTSFISDICNNKAKTYLEVSKLGIPMVDTFFQLKGYPLPDMGLLQFPVVVKSTGGRGGTEVMKADAPTELEYAMSAINADEYVIQKLCGMPGRDVRVFVVGKKIIGSVERFSSKDFRANFSQGGSAKLYDLNSEELSLVEKIIRHFDFDMVGIDFIFDSDGRFLFNEIEDIVGCRTLYMNSDIDILKHYLKHISLVMNERTRPIKRMDFTKRC